jgi:hypothetical protein
MSDYDSTDCLGCIRLRALLAAQEARAQRVEQAAILVVTHIAGDHPALVALRAALSQPAATGEGEPETHLVLGADGVVRKWYPGTDAP